MTQTPATQAAIPPALTDRFGLVVPSALPPMDVQEVRLLRLLGRLDLLTIQQIQAAVFPQLGLWSVQKRLDKLQASELLGRVATRTIAANQVGQPRKVKTKGAYAYWMTPEAKALLETLDVERDPLTLGRLKSRDSRGRKPDVRTMAHDLQVSWWCLNSLLSAAQNRYCRSIYLQTEFVSDARQRIDALIILRLSPEHPRQEGEPAVFPLFDGTPRARGEIDVRLALEVDRGSEELKVLLAKMAAYRDLTLNQTYSENLGGPVLPVFLVQTARRAAQIATEFRDIWPSGWGVVATPQSANHPSDGVLWGRYKSLGRAEAFELLTNMLPNSSGQMQFFPAIDRATWRKGVIEASPPALTPEQIAGRRGGQATAARRAAAAQTKPSS
ncbi:MAG TPA: replication-relaxation family protein [Kouleothrix sp.]|nr:replication-relaxation family protein [Kouleothrix sp.]